MCYNTIASAESVLGTAVEEIERVVNAQPTMPPSLSWITQGLLYCSPSWWWFGMAWFLWSLVVWCFPFRVKHVLHAGGKSCVMTCSHLFSSVDLVAKVDRDEEPRVAREAQCLWRLRHICGIPALHAFGLWHSTPVLVMTFMGVTSKEYMLRDVLHRLQQSETSLALVHLGLSAEAIENIARQLVPILLQIHARGVLHRDIAPSNIAVLNGRWGILDFGSAGALGAADVYPDTGIRTFAFQAEFASDRLQDSRLPLSADDDFDALIFSLSYLRDARAWQNNAEMGVRWVCAEIRELVTSLRQANVKRKDE
jgi:serine/threonine protein kinase